jgi:hypothetical protein
VRGCARVVLHSRSTGPKIVLMTQYLLRTVQGLGLGSSSASGGLLIRFEQLTAGGHSGSLSVQMRANPIVPRRGPGSHQLSLGGVIPRS